MSVSVNADRSAGKIDSTTEYVLSVDGGGTSTRVAALALDGRLLGYGRSGPSNYDDVGVETAQANIGSAVAAACEPGGLSSTQRRAAFLGMAGVVSAEDHAAIHGIAGRLQLAQPEQIGVDHDCRIALAGGLAGRPGIVQIVGTGTSCYGRNAAGEGWMTGGRGHLISDEGSGYWLGIQAMRAAVMAHDGRLEQTTVLLPIVYTHLGIRHMDEILHRLYVQGMTRAEIATLGPLVVEAARAGDGAALGLLRQGAEELAACVWAAARHLGLDAAPCEVCCVGGLIQAGPIVTDGLYAAIQRRLPTAILREAELPPVLGAGLLALQQVGSSITPAVLQNLDAAKQLL
jgi:N-acetylglucosamine kinase-like BadF-type ATPase